jgi:hypothetical protein
VAEFLKFDVSAKDAQFVTLIFYQQITSSQQEQNLKPMGVLTGEQKNTGGIFGCG